MVNKIVGIEWHFLAEDYPGPFRNCQTAKHKMAVWGNYKGKTIEDRTSSLGVHSQTQLLRNLSDTSLDCSWVCTPGNRHICTAVLMPCSRIHPSCEEGIILFPGVLHTWSSAPFSPIVQQSLEKSTFRNSVPGLALQHLSLLHLTLVMEPNRLCSPS